MRVDFALEATFCCHLGERLKMADIKALQLETDRLILRPLSAEDADAHISMMADPAVARFLSLTKEPESYELRWSNFAAKLGHWQMLGFGFFSLFERRPDGGVGEWAGRVGPLKPAGWPALEVGWGIAPAFWGRGYAPEAARATMQWTFDVFPDLDRIISLIDPENANSQAVAKKIGETNSGETFQLQHLTLDIWSVSRDEFFAQ